MASRWFMAPRSPSVSDRVREETHRSLPARAADSWRTWVMTGVRRAPIDRRRVRGAHRGLKELLVQGFNGDGEPAKPWKDFSGAMVRQSVDEAVNSLPAEHKHVVKLAYFGGLSNSEIAHELGMPVGGVRRRLREALATVSAYVERGHAAGRRAAYAVAGWLAARSLVDQAQRPGTHQLLQAALVATAGAGVAVLLVATPAAPAQNAQTRGGGSHAAAPAGAAPAKATNPAAPSVNVPAVSPSLPALPKAPSLPTRPVLHLRVPVTVTLPPVTIPPLPKHLP